MNSWIKQRAGEWRKHPLLVALLCSCVIHLAIFLLWRMGILELPDQLVRFFVKRRPAATDRNRASTNAPPLVMKEIPLVFIEIEPNPAPAPKDPKFYSSANSVAANPDANKQTAVPKADGKQDKVPRLRDVPRAVLPPPPSPPPATPRPTPPPPKPEMTLQPAPAKETPPAGNTEQAKPLEAEKRVPEKPIQNPDKTEPLEKIERAETKEKESPTLDTGSKPRPRSLAAARQQAGLVGEKMKQDGGVHRPGKLSVDAKATPFGEYDSTLIQAIQARWYELIDKTTATPRSGKVVLQFNLMYDGRITDMAVRETEVGEALSLLCQRAVTDPSPYPRWPSHMHQTVGGNVRPVTITFFYY